jgi:RNA polymerase sigma factor (TIGR02999 family)
MHSDNRQTQITQILRRIDDGDARAAESLFPLVYDELRGRAGKLMGAERADHTLQRTALVHEAYLRLAGNEARFHGRLHFLNAAALAMRRILINHATHKKRLKRGGPGSKARVSGGADGAAPAVRIDLDEVDAAAAASPDSDPIDWIALDDALAELSRRAPRQAEVVNLRFFAGLGDAEIAELLKISEPTVRRDWAAAKLWLCRHMDG